MKELLSLLEENQIDVLKEILSEEQPEDIAEFCSLVPEDSLVDVFRLLPKQVALDTFIEMEIENRQILVENLFEEKYFLDHNPVTKSVTAYPQSVHFQHSSHLIQFPL